MIDFGALIPIVAIMASAWVTVSILHYRQGRGAFRRETRTGDDPRENVRLAHENARLNATVERLEDRIAVLERIATDPA